MLYSLDALNECSPTSSSMRLHFHFYDLISAWRWGILGVYHDLAGAFLGFGVLEAIISNSLSY